MTVGVAPRLSVRFGRSQQVFEATETIKIGRSPGADFTIDNALVSRKHAQIRFVDELGGWVVEDLGSATGIFLDGRSVEQAELQSESILRLGDPDFGPEISLEILVQQPTPIDENTQGEQTQLAGPVPRRQSGKLATLPADLPGLIIGKSEESEVVINDVLVSRRHAKLCQIGHGWVIEDLNSLNGTFVNGQLVSVSVVFDGDIITVGNTDLVLSNGNLIPAKSIKSAEGGLQVHGLEFRIKGGKRLLHDIDIPAAPGTLTAVIGPSGAGKSTLSRVLAGVTEPTAGQVIFDGFDVHQNFELIRSRIGLVPQDDVLHTSLKLEEALTYAAKLRLPIGHDQQTRQAQVTKVIEQLELDNHKATRIDRLSGGQRKRASVALELLTEPSLLILDEPTSGLDPALDRQVMLTLRELATDDRAVLVITHSVAYLDVCDQVLVLAPGGMPAYLGPASGIENFFGTSDWADIFASLAQDPEGSHRHYRDIHPARPRSNLQPIANGSSGYAPAKTPRSLWWRQFFTLCSRQAKLIFADRGYSTFLLALPVILGLLVLVVPGDTGLGPADSEAYGEPSQLLAMLVIGAAFMGASISIRDLVGERAIFLRERAVGLSISVYLASKLFVYGIFSWLMAALLTIVLLLGKPGPTQSILGIPPALELFFALGLTAMCSMALGLFLSALVKSTEQAMPLLIVVLMAQLVLNGGIIKLVDQVGLNEFSYFAISRWGYAMAASSTDLQNLSPVMTEDPLWDHTFSAWLLAAELLIVLTIIFSALTRARLTSRYA